MNIEIILFVIFFIILPLLYIKFKDEENNGKDIGNLKAWFLLAMHFLGWPFVYIFCGAILPIVTIPYFICKLIKSWFKS